MYLLLSSLLIHWVYKNLFFNDIVKSLLFTDEYFTPRFEVFVVGKVYVLVSRVVVVVPYVVTDVSEDTGALILTVELQQFLPTYLPTYLPSPQVIL